MKNEVVSVLEKTTDGRLLMLGNIKLITGIHEARYLKSCVL